MLIWKPRKDSNAKEISTLGADGEIRRVRTSWSCTLVAEEVSLSNEIPENMKSEWRHRVL